MTTSTVAATAPRAELDASLPGDPIMPSDLADHRARAAYDEVIHKNPAAADGDRDASQHLVADSMTTRRRTQSATIVAYYNGHPAAVYLAIFRPDRRLANDR